LGIAIARARSRASTRLADADVIAQLWRHFTDVGEPLEHHVIDNSDQSASATAAVVDERLQRGSLAV
jgi:hypothetical protein